MRFWKLITIIQNRLNPINYPNHLNEGCEWVELLLSAIIQPMLCHRTASVGNLSGNPETWINTCTSFQMVLQICSASNERISLHWKANSVEWQASRGKNCGVLYCYGILNHCISIFKMILSPPTRVGKLDEAPRKEFNSKWQKHGLSCQWVSLSHCTIREWHHVVNCCGAR